MSSARLIETNGTAYRSCDLDMSAAHIEHTDIQVKDVSNIVSMHCDCFSMTNHMLRQVRGYLPAGIIVRQFWFFPHLQWIIVAVFSVSFLSIFLLMLNIVVLVVVINLFIIVCQYVYICYNHLPWLLLVPVVNIDKSSLNFHIEIEISHVEGTYLRAKEAGLFRAAAVNGRIKLLVMKPKMDLYIRRSRYFTFFLFVYGIFTLSILSIFLIININSPIV